jgi:hypothetical protein
LPMVELPVWYDVDDKDSLNRLLSELFSEWSMEKVSQGAPAPNTKEFLQRLLTRASVARVWPAMAASLLERRDPLTRPGER